MVSSALLAGIQSALLFLPMLWSAEVSKASSADRSSRNQVTLITFNMAWAARPVDNIAAYLLQHDADIVLLQEATEAHTSALNSALAAKYPYTHACGAIQGCTQMILSKRPWVSVQHVHRTSGGPEMISARFDDAAFGRFHVYGIHLAWPFTPNTQDRHIDRLIALRRSISEPAIFAGDLNLTPWSYQLQRWLWAGDLRQHAMFLRTWPTDGQFRLPVPLFQIDHVITTPDIKTVSITTGPNLGSDHLPIIARLELPLH